MSSWIPDESAQTLFSERCWFQGVIITSIAYGISVCLYLLSFALLVRDKNRVKFKKRLPLLIYITATLLFDTLFTVSLVGYTQMAFIDDRNFPGGPDVFENDMWAIPISFLNSVTMVLSSWLSDALVVWRFKVIYQQCWIPLWIVMFFSCLMLAGSIVMGILLLIQASTTSPYLNHGANYILAFFIVSLALNIILTIAIVLRLLRFRYQAVATLGPRHGTHYTSFAAIIIESATLYSAVSITFLVLFGIQNSVSQVLIQSLCQFQTIATLLIVFRVAQGKAWTDDTAAHVISPQEMDVLEDQIRWAIDSYFSRSTVESNHDGANKPPQIPALTFGDKLDSTPNAYAIDVNQVHGFNVVYIV